MRDHRTLPYTLLALVLGASLSLASTGCPENDDDDSADDDDMADDDMADDDMADDDMGDDDMGDDDMGDDDTGDDDMGDDDMGDDDTTGNPTATAVDCGMVSADATVDITDFSFLPDAVTIDSGQVVQWTNLDGTSHTVTSGNPGDMDAGLLFDSGDLAQGQSYCLAFQGTASHPYFCLLHPKTMFGAEVIVQ